MNVQRFRSVGLAALSYSMVLLSVRFTAGNAQTGCIPSFLADGDCDPINNNVECGYDNGDCCKDSCISQGYICGGNWGYECDDPDYSETSYSYSFGCDEAEIGNGFCNLVNNNEDCGYDGGDCCDCTCPTLPGTECDGPNRWTCKDPTAPCMQYFMEAAVVTTVTVSTNGFDPRSGEASGDRGCLGGGCHGSLTRDNDVENDESRWSCKRDLVPNREKCQITFSFEQALDIEYVQVAFLRADRRSRSLQVTSNGVDVGTLHSSPDSLSAYNTFVLHADDVETVSLTTTRRAISLLEVRFMLNGKNYWYGGGADYGDDTSIRL